MKFILLTLCILSSFTTASQISITRKNSECLIDENNKELIPCGRYADISGPYAYDKDRRYFIVTNFYKKQGFYSIAEDKEVVPCIYDEITKYWDFGFVKKENKWAIINNNFKVVSDFVYDEVRNFYEPTRRAWARTGNKWILIDTAGRRIKNIPFETLDYLNDGDLYVKAGNGNKYGYTDMDANIVIPAEYEDVSSTLRSAIFPVKKNGKWGYVNKENKVIVPIKYDELSGIYEGFGYIRDKNYNVIGYTDANGKVIFDDARYTYVEYVGAGRLVFVVEDSARNRRSGFLDSATGNVVMPAQFEGADRFFNQRAVVKKGGLLGAIDPAGKVIVPFKYDNLVKWGSRYLANINGKMGVLDSVGNAMTPFEYDQISTNGKLITCYKNKMAGVLDYDCNLLIAPVKYDFIQPVSNSVFLASKGSKRYLVNVNGKEREIE